MPNKVFHASRTTLLACLLAVLSTILPPSPARAQSITQGALVGTVTDAAGAPLFRVSVTLLEPGQQTGTTVMTGRGGGFVFPALPPGNYELLVELVGYHPKFLVGVPVRANASVQASVALDPVTGDVIQIDSVSFHGGALQSSRVGQSRFFSTLELEGMPTDRRNITDMSRFSSNSTFGFETEGLPRGLGALAVDGVLFVPVTHPTLAMDHAASASLSPSGFANAELVSNGVDVEWSEVASGVLTSSTRAGAGRLAMSGFVDWSGDALASSRHFEPSEASYSSLRAGATFGGPIIPDTADFLVGLEMRREQLPYPRAWVDSTDDAALSSVTDGSFGFDLSPYLGPRVEKSEVVNGYARVGWQLTPMHSLSVRGSFASVSVASPELGLAGGSGIGVDVDGADVLIGATLASRLPNGIAQEFRIGFESTRRDYRAVQGPSSTVLASGGQRFGTDPSLPGEFSQGALRASETVHLVSGSHRFKIGGGVTARLTDQTFAYGQRGEYVFSNVQDFAALNGAFTQTVATGVPNASFTVLQFAGFVQDVWAAAPGLDVTFGLRYEHERVPRTDIRRHEEWFNLTGIDNSAVSLVSNKFSPRIGFSLHPGQRSDWVVRGAAGIYYGLIDNALISEAITHTGAIEVRRGFGPLGSWPTAPAASATPVRGPRLSFLGPKLEAPRTTRVGFGVSRSIGATTALHLSTTYRHTDFLVRRANLNRMAAPTTEDQYGRPIYGTLVQQGELLAPVPGTNRRFGSFDLVSALNPDGFSDYWDITVLLERTFADAANVVVSYTYSHTIDNWLSGHGGGPDDQLSPFPDSLAGADWADGTSDFDIPHRFLIGAEVALPVGRRSRLAAFFRYDAGRPFTPGYRDGVDANGDGSARNDVAFVDASIQGMSQLISAWPCLAQQSGQFADRNSCRSAPNRRLDLRLTLGVARVGPYPVSVLVEGLNLIDPEEAIIDRALVRVDETSSLLVNPTTGVVTVPLIANPNFGEPIAQRGFGRFVRIGARVNY